MDGVAEYPAVLLVDVLKRAVDDAVMSGLADAGFDDITRAHGVVFEMVDPGGSRVVDMARRARMTKQAMGQLVAAVEELGYVERIPDPSDGRAQLVRVTRRGERAAAAGRNGLERLEREWASVAGDRRFATTHRVLVDLVRATAADHVR